MPGRNDTRSKEKSGKKKKTLRTLFGEVSADTEFYMGADFTFEDLKNDRLLNYWLLEGPDWRQFPKFSPVEIARRRLADVEWCVNHGYLEEARMILNGPDKLPQFRARWERGLWPIATGPSMGPRWIQAR